jgi:hypothetical protein
MIQQVVDMRSILKKMPFLGDGRILLGIVFLIAGLFIAREGILKLRDLWHQISPFFPLSIPDSVAQKAIHYFPAIFKFFVVIVSSVCAILIGALWAISGARDLLHGREKVDRPAELEGAELVAESIRLGRTLYWESTPWMVRLLSKLWAPARDMSPISYQFLKEILQSFLKIALLALLVALIFSFLKAMPAVLQKYLHVSIKLLVPSAGPLYFLLGLVAFINCLILVNLVPFKKLEFIQRCEVAPVAGRGDPHVFFALLEEGCKLLTVKGQADGSAVRLEGESEPQMKGSLIENYPEGIQAFVRVGGYVCLPLILLLLTMGFTRLIHFQRPIDPMPYMEFLSAHSLDYLLEVLFALGLIISGLYFAEWARKLFDVHRFRSAVIFCHTEGQSPPASHSRVASARSGPLPTTGGVRWKIAQAVDDEFAAWAKNPRGSKKFHVEVCWAEAISESLGIAGPRYLIEARRTEALDSAVSRIVELPFHVDFQIEAVACAPTPTSGACAEGGSCPAESPSTETKTPPSPK